MTRISSHFTFVFKRIFPAFWFGFVAIFFIVAAFNSEFAGFPLLLIAPVIMALIGYFVFKGLIWDLADAVHDGGDFLLVRARGEEERIALSNIAGVSDFLWMNPPRVTLTLIQPGKLGSEIVFMPRFELRLPLARYAITRELIERTAGAKRA